MNIHYSLIKKKKNRVKQNINKDLIKLNLLVEKEVYINFRLVKLQVFSITADN